MAKAVADRLAEAFAEELHERVRQEIWGYSNEETFTTSDLHQIKYQVSHPFYYCFVIYPPSHTQGWGVIIVYQVFANKI